MANFKIYRWQGIKPIVLIFVYDCIQCYWIPTLNGYSITAVNKTYNCCIILSYFISHFIWSVDTSHSFIHNLYELIIQQWFISFSSVDTYIQALFILQLSHNMPWWFDKNFIAPCMTGCMTSITGQYIIDVLYCLLICHNIFRYYL